jgi:hypothetical protein
MTRFPANRALYQIPLIIQSESFRTLEIAMTLLSARQTPLLALFQRTVQQRQFPQLSLFMNIHLIVNHNQHIANHLRRHFQLGGIVSRHHHVEGFVVPLLGGFVPPSPRTFFDRTFSPNGNFAVGFGLHLFLGFTPRTYNKPYKIIRRMLLHRYGYFNIPFPLGDKRRQRRIRQGH